MQECAGPTADGNRRGGAAVAVLVMNARTAAPALFTPVLGPVWVHSRWLLISHALICDY